MNPAKCLGWVMSGIREIVGGPDLRAKPLKQNMLYIRDRLIVLGLARAVPCCFWGPDLCGEKTLDIQEDTNRVSGTR